jgi:hypothetical protein
MLYQKTNVEEDFEFEFVVHSFFAESERACERESQEIKI